MQPWQPEFKSPSDTPDAGMQVAGSLGELIGKVVAAKREADARKLAMQRQATQDNMTKQLFDMKLSEETPGTPAGSIFPGAPPSLNLTRAEAARGWEKRAEIEAAKKAALAAKGGPGMQETPGRKAADMAFGKDYVDFATTGLPAADKGLSTLREAREELKTNGKSLTGPGRGLLPDAIRRFTNPEAVAVKERIRGAVQSTLKSTLGAQFTEKEGERIFNNAYNDTLSPEENINRLDKIIGELEAGKTSRQRMGQYFEQKGTLTGYAQPDPEREELEQLRAKHGGQGAAQSR